ncbi:MAG: hypothetical protein KA712_09460 [Myxococcales bacterium]|nr:hypothetical protein [Myxococcales bacterium]
MFRDGHGPASLLRLALFAAGLAACKAKVPQIEAPFVESFNQAEVAPVWHDTGGGYTLVEGKLSAKGARNHPLWLRKRLPRNAVIELDAVAQTPNGDIKVEVWGDGESFDPDGNSYIATGYVLIFGGWRNSLSIIARQNEHNDGVKAQRADKRVEPGRSYHFTITRKDGTIDWKVDGEPFLSYADPQPLEGSGNEYFGFNNWETEVRFDNLSIRPLP